MSIGWTKADGREWNIEIDRDGKHYIFPSFGAETLLETKIPEVALEVCISHNYRLAKARRKTWSLDEFADGSGWGIWTFGTDGEFIKTICGPVSTELEAMAEFVKLDKEMPR